MSVTVVALVSINEDQPFALARYLELTEPVLKRVGGKIVQRYFLDEEPGQRPAKTIIVVEYPDRGAVDEVFASVEYAQAIRYRDAAFSEYTIHIVE